MMALEIRVPSRWASHVRGLLEDARQIAKNTEFSDME